VVKVAPPRDQRGDLHYAAIDDKLPAGLEASTPAGHHRGHEHGPGFRRGGPDPADHLLPGDPRSPRGLLRGCIPQREYEFAYLARATTAGAYLRPATRAEAMYDPKTYATSGADYVTVK